VTVLARCATGALSLGGGLPGRAHPFSLVDLHARKVEYLRVSVTDRCNYRCTYCMPADGAEVVRRADLLTFDEVAALVRVFVGMGVRKVRLTGGEPLVRRDVVRLVDKIAAIDGVADLSMTTNGHLLAGLARPLRDAGLRRLNVSLDTLDPARFRQVTRQGTLEAVLAGLDAAAAAGFAHTKLNVVALRGLNDGEFGALADFAAQRDLLLRFIEYMPIGVDDHWGPETFLPIAEVRDRLSLTWDLAPDPNSGVPGGGPAVHWRGERHGGGLPPLRLGFIAAVSEKFCQACNRVRLSATGTLRECLSAQGALSLRDLLRGGASAASLERAIGEALSGKVAAHRFDRAVATGEAMSSIGG